MSTLPMTLRSRVGLPNVIHQIAHTGGVHTANVLLLLPHVAQRPADAGIPACKLLDELHPAPGKLLHPLVCGIGPGLHLRLDLLDEPGPLGLDLSDSLLAELLLAAVELLQLLGRIVLLYILRHLRHLHDGLNKPLCGYCSIRPFSGAGSGSQESRDAFETLAELALRFDPLLESRDVQPAHPAATVALPLHESPLLP